VCISLAGSVLSWGSSFGYLVLPRPHSALITQRIIHADVSGQTMTTKQQLDNWTNGTMNRKVILYIATSLDGYIAKPNDDLIFLSIVQQDGEDYGYADFIKSVDTVILGRKTYDWVMTRVSEFPHADKNSFIITRTAKPSIGKTNFYTGKLRDLVLRLKSEQGKNIFIDGGAEIGNKHMPAAYSLLRAQRAAFNSAT